MKSIVEFIKSIKIISWILLFFSLIVYSTILSVETNPSDFLFIVLMFLFPAIITELCSNPTIKKSHLKICQFISSSKVISRILFHLYISFSFLSTNETTGAGYFGLFVCFICFFLPSIIIEINTNPTLRFYRTKKSIKNAKYDLDKENFHHEAELASIYDSIEKAKAVHQEIITSQKNELDRINSEIEYEYKIKSNINDDNKFEKLKNWRVENGYGEFKTDSPNVELENKELQKLDIAPKKISISNMLTKDMAYVDSLDGHSFEYFCADLLLKNGFSKAEVTQGSGDQGADILATKDNKTYAIQCKHRENPLATKFGNKPIQEVYASIPYYNCDGGIVMTNGYFTDGGIDAANACGIKLWDREVIVEMIINGKIKYQYAEPSSKDFSKDTSLEISTDEVNGISIFVDTESFSIFGLEIRDFSIDNESSAPNELEILFDIYSNRGIGLLTDIEIVCNVYGNNRKLATEKELVVSDKFRKRDSLSLCVDKNNICKLADKIELYCVEF